MHLSTSAPSAPFDGNAFDAKMSFSEREGQTSIIYSKHGGGLRRHAVLVGVPCMIT